MKFNVQLSEQEFLSTSEVSYDMKITEQNTPLMFKMLVEQLYKNKLGSMIREVTSNAVDSHIEAGVKEPVIVELKKDVNTHYISFIDNGVGMSPHRISEVYGSLGESTKRNTNKQIGGFGIGGKTPLAYNKSFYLITRYNGLEYFYSIRMDNFVPKIELMQQSTTDEGNGTEVKVPLNINDIRKAEQEIERQLLYFDNVYYKGFENVKNDFKIFEGENFKYRENDYYSSMHICLGNVAYPIDWNELNISYLDIPIGLKFETGELRTVPSREDLEYSDETIKVILKKIEAVKKELGDILTKKYQNVVTLKDYYDVTEDFGKLTLLGNKSINIRNLIKRTDIYFTNFIYNDLLNGSKKIPSREMMFEYLFTYKRYGKVEPKRSWKTDGADKFNGYFENLTQVENIYLSGEPFNRKLIKQSYLKEINNGRFYVVIPKVSELGSEIRMLGMKSNVQDIDDDYLELYNKFRNEFIEYIIKILPLYDNIIVPDNYLVKRKKSSYNKKKVINVKSVYGGNDKVKLNHFAKLRGTFVYGFRDDKYTLNNAFLFAKSAFNNVNSTINFNDRGICFNLISKQSEDLIKETGIKMIHVDNFFKLYGSRKLDAVVVTLIKEEINNKFYERHEAIKRISFENIDKDIYEANKKIKDWLDSSNNMISESNIYNLNNYYKLITGKYVDNNLLSEFVFKKELDYLLDKTTQFNKLFKFVKIPYYSVDDKTKLELEEFLIKLLK